MEGEDGVIVRMLEWIVFLCSDFMVEAKRDFQRVLCLIFKPLEEWFRYCILLKTILLSFSCSAFPKST